MQGKILVGTQNSEVLEIDEKNGKIQVHGSIVHVLCMYVARSICISMGLLNKREENIYLIVPLVLILVVEFKLPVGVINCMMY